MSVRFVESANVDARLIRKIDEKELQEKLQGASRSLRESIEKTPHKNGWEVPISKYDVQNANRRIYPRALWERVIKEQRHIWEGAPMLADHPAGESDGSPLNICGVWVDARIDDNGYVYGTVVPSGSLGRDFEDHLSNGLRAGTSSSGFGDLQADQLTVDPSTYLIERLSDWVLTPSQGTYFTYEAATRETKNASDSERMGESVNKPQNVVKENTRMKLAKLEEKKFRKDMMSFLEDAYGIKDPQDQLKEFEEILSYFEEGACPDLREQVTEKIKEKKAEINDMIANSLRMKEELGIKDTSDLKEKLTSIANDTVVLKEEVGDWKKIVANLQKKLDEAYAEIKSRPTEAYTAHLKSKINRLYKENREQKQNYANLLEASKKHKESSVMREKSIVSKDSGAILSQRKQIEMHVRENLKLNKLLKEAEEKAKLSELKFKRLARKVEREKNPVKPVSSSAKIKEYLSFKEAGVDSYWEDLKTRHGKEILPYEKDIRECKTVREAMAAYLKVESKLSEAMEYDSLRIPESVGISLKERASMLEKHNVKISGADMIDRLPKGWK